MKIKMISDVKQLIVNQCAPVFMGIKPAALFPLRSALCLDCLPDLLPRNIDLLVLRETEGKPLVLAYNKVMLEETLSSGAVRRFLSDCGYPAEARPAFSTPSALSYLKARFSAHNFPHEVGLFLGYPLEDVTGFIRYRGKNYKLQGYWKVYGDVEGAKRLFHQYDLCRECMKGYS